MVTEWNSSAQLQTMSGGERVPAYLTMYAPPNHPPPGRIPQAPVYNQEPSAQSFSRGQSAYGYGYDF
ncbi:hypothetical protein EXIGLDRAFT_721676 [Exidia glandulosa HHB12029]|uniref:Uncharacterized protein n=1 Tax=Exidia glandulosa HHB12029 TaxID=1314781 RepID=A0A165QCT0_EXIGL|nr:hypothetical protein EXIGLDRAFT_721676 [Exidia glandulosa HHB12029]